MAEDGYLTIVNPLSYTGTQYTFDIGGNSINHLYNFYPITIDPSNYGDVTTTVNISGVDYTYSMLQLFTSQTLSVSWPLNGESPSSIITDWVAARMNALYSSLGTINFPGIFIPHFNAPGLDIYGPCFIAVDPSRFIGGLVTDSTINFYIPSYANVTINLTYNYFCYFSYPCNRLPYCYLERIPYAIC